MTEKNKPIGVFDSGLGGLTVVRAIKEILPNEGIVYFGDTGRVPYGTRSKETIKRYAVQDENFLLEHNVKIIIAACGTVSSVAFDTGENLPVPFIGVVEPAAVAAAAATENGRIGITGTSATINSKSYENIIKGINPEIQTFAKACPLFVSIVEEGIVSSDPELARQVIRHYLEDFKKADVDTLILGCTHFPILEQLMGEYMPNVRLINPGLETAKHSLKILKEKDLLNDNNKAEYEYYVSDETSGFAKQANIFLGEDISNSVKKTSLE